MTEAGTPESESSSAGSAGGPLDEFLDQGELCRLLKISRHTVNRWRMMLGLRAYRIGNRFWFDEAEVARFIREKLGR
jgi:excisionase family DNA binding protein